MFAKNFRLHKLRPGKKYGPMLFLDILFMNLDGFGEEFSFIYDGKFLAYFLNWFFFLFYSKAINSDKIFSISINFKISPADGD